MHNNELLFLQIIMVLSKFLPTVLAFQSVFSIAVSDARLPSSRCKTYPNDPGWPSSETWQKFGQTVSSLIKPQALASVCRPDSLDELACFTITAQWSNSSWVAENAYMGDYNEESCPLNSTLPCSTRGYPAYVVDARTSADVQAAINFARKHDLRLTIKGTGHDYPGRSSGSQALSIWTHNLRGIEIDMGSSKAVQYGGSAAVTIAAGHRWREVYEKVAQFNLTIVGGGDNNVGVGGWYLNGGHSPVSSIYGLGADQILSLEVVTADGQLLTVDEASHPDLFFALRGGGSAFGVVTKLIVKAYPQASAVMSHFEFGTLTGSDTYASLLTHFHSHIIDINEAGGMGYYYALPGAYLDPTLVNQSLLTGVWIFLNKTEAQVSFLLEPLYSTINDSAWAIEPITSTISNTETLSFIDSWRYIPPEGVGSSGRLTSWLLDEKALSNVTALRQQLEIAMSPDGFIIGHVVAGPGVRNARIPGGSNAVLPAWRKAYSHTGKFC